jgi:uncharacterized protein YfiM (DUF2279 family)
VLPNSAGNTTDAEWSLREAGRHWIRHAISQRSGSLVHLAVDGTLIFHRLGNDGPVANFSGHGGTNNQHHDVRSIVAAAVGRKTDHDRTWCQPNSQRVGQQSSKALAKLIMTLIGCSARLITADLLLSDKAHGPASSPQARQRSAQRQEDQEVLVKTHD